MSGTSPVSPASLLQALRAMEKQGDGISNDGLSQANPQFEETLALIRQISELRAARKAPRAEGGVPPKIAKLVRSMSDQISAMAEHSEMIACGLGACPECWGGDLDCVECAGEGVPGFFLPDEECFERFVAPVVARREEHLGKAPTSLKIPAGFGRPARSPETSPRSQPKPNDARRPRRASQIRPKHRGDHPLKDHRFIEGDDNV